MGYFPKHVYHQAAGYFLPFWLFVKSSIDFQSPFGFSLFPFH